MTNTKQLLLIVFCCNALVTSVVIADENANVKFITLGLVDFPPFSYLDESRNECIGYFVSTTRQLFAEYNIRVKAICAPAARVYRMMRNVEIDLTVNVRTTKLLQAPPWQH